MGFKEQFRPLEIISLLIIFLYDNDDSFLHGEQFSCWSVLLIKVRKKNRKKNFSSENLKKKKDFQDF